jgi:hypothetical protein
VRSPRAAPPCASAISIVSSHLELRRAAQAEHLAHVQRVVKRRALVVQHHVVRAGHPHDEVDAGRAEQRQQRVHVVLVGFGVVRVADVAAHRHAEQLAAEVILQPARMICLPSYRYSGPMKPTTVFTSNGSNCARDRIRAPSQVCWSTPKCALADSALPWPVSKYITLLPTVPRASDSGGARLAEQRERDAEARVGLLGARDRLEHQVDRRALVDRRDRVGHVGEHAGLGRDA